MRTTLKRGVGRGAALNGADGSTCPPGPLAPVAIYRQPPAPPRSGSLARRPDPGLVGARARGPRRRHRRRCLPLPPRVGRRCGTEVRRGEEGAQGARRRSSRPARDRARGRVRPPRRRGEGHALALGHADARARRPRREDHLDALVPARPERRDPVPGTTPFVAKINAAYATCGPTGALATSETSPGSRSTTSSRSTSAASGSSSTSSAASGWTSTGGTSTTTAARRATRRSTSRPGYQRLNGTQALDFVRFRHTDSDVYRTARQQLFVRSFKDQIESAFSLTRLPQVIKVVTSNVEVGQGGGKDVSPKTVLRYAALALLASPRAHFPGADRRARGLRRPDDVSGEHPAGGARVPGPGRRVAAQGDGSRAGREAEGARRRRPARRP